MSNEATKLASEPTIEPDDEDDMPDLIEGLASGRYVRIPGRGHTARYLRMRRAARAALDAIEAGAPEREAAARELAQLVLRGGWTEDEAAQNEAAERKAG